MKVTLKDIGKKLGISHATVSLALNNSPKVTEATRNRVLAAAKELDYHPNPYLSALMAARRKGKEPKDAPVIALVTPNRTADYWKNRYHIRRFIESCRHTAAQVGVRTELFWIGEEGMSAPRMNEIFFNRNILGAVLMTHGIWGEKLDHAWADVATVTYGVRSLTPDTDWVGADFYGNMETALFAIRAMHYQRVGFIMDVPFPYTHHNRWLSAYRMEQSMNTIALVDPWLDPEPSFDGFGEWFSKEKPDVILCVRPKMVIEWLETMGINVPHDVGVAAIGTAERGGDISGIVENTGTCGQLAVEMLMGRIHRSEFGQYVSPKHVIVKGQWNPGKTILPASAAGIPA
jgi:DNA-binding LacI/PurR family transcriptional regulator